MATAFGRAKKVMEQLERLSDQQADDLIDDGYIAAVREAKQSGTLPDREVFRQFLGLDKCLRRMATVDLPARETSFTDADYFQTGEGLFIWEGFKNRILSVAGTAATTSVTKVTSFDLQKDSADQQIRAELPEDHVFSDASVFCSHLAGLIDRQPNGKEGTLLNNGYANIFYVNIGVGVVAVSVRWLAGDRRWRVGAYELLGNVWDAGYRVFSATAVS